MPRTVKFEPRFESELAAIEPEVERADKCVSGAIWALAKDPWMGKPTADPEVRALAFFADEGYPSLLVYYTFDDESIFLVGAAGPSAQLTGHLPTVQLAFRPDARFLMTDPGFDVPLWFWILLAAAGVAPWAALGALVLWLIARKKK